MIAISVLEEELKKKKIMIDLFDKKMIIPPSIYNAYHICKREAWLMYHQVSGDQFNDFMMIGKLLSGESFKKDKHEIILADLPAKIDLIKKKNGKIFIAEIKKSSKKIKNAEIQLKYYLYLLHKKGYHYDGMIKIPKERISIDVVLTEIDIEYINNSLLEIEDLLKSNKPPPSIKLKLCPKCAHFEFCWG